MMSAHAPTHAPQPSSASPATDPAPPRLIPTPFVASNRVSPTPPAPAVAGQPDELQKEDGNTHVAFEGLPRETLTLFIHHCEQCVIVIHPSLP